jgi:hypothetical protein
MLRLDLDNQPGTPISPPSPDPRGKRPNLLVDLIETEKLYVDQMAGIIRVRRLIASSAAIAHTIARCIV